LTVIDVAAGSTTPTITGEQVYDENLEWDVESIGTGTVNPASVAAPWVNLYSIETTNCQNGFKLILNRTTPFDYDSFDVQSLRLKQKSSLGGGQSLGIQFLDSANAPVTNIVPLSIVKADLNYQYLAVAKESFTPVGVNQAQKLAIVFTRVSGGATYSGFFVDDWKIQSGIISPPTVSTIQLTNEVLASGASNSPIPVSLTEKAISNRAEEGSWANDDFLLFWKAADQKLYKIKKSNLGISGGGVGAGAGLSIDGGGDIQLGDGVNVFFDIDGSVKQFAVDLLNIEGYEAYTEVDTSDSSSDVYSFSISPTGYGSGARQFTQAAESYGEIGSNSPLTSVLIRSLVQNDDGTITLILQNLSTLKEVGLTVFIESDGSSSVNTFRDDPSEKGLVYADDYSTNGAADPRWIPDWGAVTAAITAGGGGDMTAEEIRDELETLTGTDRLPASAIKDLPVGEPVTDVFTWTTGPQEFTLTEANVGDPDVYLNTTFLDPAKWSIAAGVVTITETLPAGTHKIFIKYYKTSTIVGYPEYAFSADQFYLIGGTIFRRGGNIPQDTSGGITLTFRKNTMYGTPAAPLSSTISEDFTGDYVPNMGAEAILWYNGSSLAFTSGSKYKRIHGTYGASVLNKIIFRYYSDTYITYEIYQEL